MDSSLLQPEHTPSRLEFHKDSIYHSKGLIYPTDKYSLMNDRVNVLAQLLVLSGKYKKEDLIKIHEHAYSITNPQFLEE